VAAPPEGAGTGVASARVGAGTGVAAPALPGARGTALAAAARPDGADGAGTGEPLVGTAVGRADGPVLGGLVPSAGGLLAVCAAADAVSPAPAAETAPEHPVSASPAATPSAATPSTGPNVTSGVLSLIRTCMLLSAVGDVDPNTGKYVIASEKLCRCGSNLSPCLAV
jgi:hypothetical protein